MPIIFGWGKQTIEEFGKSQEHECTNCGHVTSWALYTVTTWFTLFFMPVLPYNLKRYLACPVCTNRVEITKDEFDYYNTIALVKESFTNGIITEEEKNQALEYFNSKKISEFDENELRISTKNHRSTKIKRILEIAIPIILVLVIYFWL